MSVLYGDSSGNYPACWGRRDVYDSENRECRGCRVQSTCRNQVLKQTIAQQQAVPQVSQIPTYAPQPYTYPYPQPQQYAPQPAPVPVRYQPAPAPIAPPPVARMQIQNYATPQQVVAQPAQIPSGYSGDWYGRVQDPLFMHVLSSPPFRPQMMGETFKERLAKNVLLDVIALILGHGFLALRQMVLPPSNR